MLKVAFIVAISVLATASAARAQTPCRPTLECAQVMANASVQMQATLSSMTTLLAAAQDQIAKQNAEIVAIRNELNALKSRNVFANRGCVAHSVIEVGESDNLICPEGQYVAGAPRYKKERQTDGIVCCPTS